MSVSVQDLVFAEGDDFEMTKRKLRILVDEVQRLARELEQYVSINPETQAVDFRAAALDNAAQPGMYPMPNQVAGYIDITINGQAGRVPVFLPAP